MQVKETHRPYDIEPERRDAAILRLAIRSVMRTEELRELVRDIESGREFTQANYPFTARIIRSRFRVIRQRSMPD